MKHISLALKRTDITDLEYVNGENGGQGTELRPLWLIYTQKDLLIDLMQKVKEVRVPQISFLVWDSGIGLHDGVIIDLGETGQK